THSFTAQPPDLRRFALITRASRFYARSPCSATPSIRFLSIGSQLTLRASSPRSVTLTQLRFASFAMINSWRDLHPQECAHAGRTKKTHLAVGFFASGLYYRTWMDLAWGPFWPSDATKETRWFSSSDLKPVPRM